MGELDYISGGVRITTKKCKKCSNSIILFDKKSKRKGLCIVCAGKI